MIDLRYQLTVTLPDGPRRAVTDVLTVEAYDVFAVTLDPAPAAGATQTLQLLSAAAAAAATFVMITASVYQDVTYDVAASGTARPLDGPHLLIGAGAVSLLPAPTTITLVNASAEPRAVEILIGRDL